MTNLGKSISLVLLLVLVFGGYYAFTQSMAAKEVIEDDHGHEEVRVHDEEEHGEHAGHGHDELVETTLPLSVVPNVASDTRDGFNVRLVTESFEFAPELVGGEHVDGRGHAHVYIDDVLVTRAYGEWVYLPHIEAGEHELRVTLNTNNHAVYAIDGEPVESVTTIIAQ